MSGSCRYFNLNAFALLLVHFRTLVTGCGSSILRRPNQSPNRQFRPKISWCGELLNATTRQVRWSDVDPDHLKRNLTSAGQSRPSVKQWKIRHKAFFPTLFSWAIFGYPEKSFFSWFFLICKAIAKRLHQTVYPQSHDFNMRSCLTVLKTLRATQPNYSPTNIICFSWAMVFFMPKSEFATKNGNR